MEIRRRMRSEIGRSSSKWIKNGYGDVVEFYYIAISVFLPVL